MKTRSSRLRGLYKMKVAERRTLIAEAAGMPVAELAAALDSGGLTPETADKFVENVLGTYALPFGVAVNVRVNGKDYIVPMVVEEPSVIAAASNAAKMVRAGSGFIADVDPSIMTCQVQLFDVTDEGAGAADILLEKEELLAMANRAVPGLVERGGGARDLEVRHLDGGMLVVHIYVDCRDAMGANLVNNVAEAVGDRIAQLGGGNAGCASFPTCATAAACACARKSRCMRSPPRRTAAASSSTASSTRHALPSSTPIAPPPTTRGS